MDCPTCASDDILTFIMSSFSTLSLKLELMELDRFTGLTFPLRTTTIRQLALN
jgi:hypothetical protein